ncbi:hypothetical protein RSOLAG1IB_08785 [Rhizoctonia solani AG-1 IB]|uniref:Fungal lipase-type domain-containing protein n=1 Tax=Thanatephorus cucumeris (strain AG1-IB / isolate 7/3/14) TaxID=1108050 RepID=A0A0B7FP98_THACB|nr:hypothetical protein RSOLAG1IB_08785 [Rhizoctonia solani AG-1 IB]
MFMLGLSAVLLATFRLVVAVPLRRDGVTALSTPEISSYAIYAQAIHSGGILPALEDNELDMWWYVILQITGIDAYGVYIEACNIIPDFIPYAAGGDGATIPYWYIGYHAGSHSVVVSNQGSDFDHFQAIIVNSRIDQKNLNSTLFPGISQEVRAHSGFADVQAISAEAKLAAVQSVMSNSGTSNITLTGHSLGGAISLLDSLYLSFNLPSATIKVVTHGMPRVGNNEFANLIDSKITDLSRITNMQDPVPILPGRRLDYVHPSGEKHILGAGSWASCAGHDNTDNSCTTGAVPTIFHGNSKDHIGPYEGIYIGNDYCI